MPRGNRLRGEGGVFHVTHRCHNRRFLLKFARDRDAYRTRLRQQLHHHDLSVLDYCLTSNHVHLLVDAQERLEVSSLMRCVAGEFARAYNRRKGRSNAFWGDNFHATLVEGGAYRWRCLVYIELNMVRAGMVNHPSQWEWVGHHEIMGRRERYRLLDLERLCWRLGTDDLAAVRRHFEASLEEALVRDGLRRQPCWTESLAVGSAGFVKRIQPLILSRHETEIAEAAEGLWVLREPVVPYVSETSPKTKPKADL